MAAWELPEGWEWRTLGGENGICEVNPRRPRLQRDLEKPTSFLPMEEIDEVSGTIKKLQTQSYSDVKSGYTYFEENDVLFAKITPSMQNGKSVIAKGLIDGFGFGSTEFHVLRPKPSVEPKWVHHFVRQLSLREEAMQHFRGAVGQQRVPASFLEEHSIPVAYPGDSNCSLAEQRRIVDRIKALLSEVGEARRLHHHIVEDTAKVMDSVLIETVNQLYTSSPTTTIKQLRDKKLLKISGGGTPSKRKPEYWAGEIPWVSPKDMKCWIISDTEDHISSEAIEESSAKLIPKNSVLVVVRGMILARTWPVAVAGVDLAVNQDMKALIPNHELKPSYLGYILRGLTPRILDQVETAAHGTRRLKTQVLEALAIPLLSELEQRHIVAYLDTVQDEVQAMQSIQVRDRQSLEQVEQAILAQAFRGEL